MLKDLEALCAAVGVSGDERDACIVAENLLRPFGEISRTPLSSVICRLPCADPSRPHIMLTAHLDTIGMMVSQVTEDGLVAAVPCGGLDRRSLSCARVTVFATGEEARPLLGVVAAPSRPFAAGDAVAPKADRILIDLGLPQKEAQRLCRAGDRIVFQESFTPLLGDRVASPFLDDRAGCAVVIGAARLLHSSQKANVSVALVSREETGSAGAATAAHILAPDIAWAVDVSFALTPDDKPQDCGQLGQGPMIGFAPILDRDLSKQAIELAKAHHLPYQLEIMGGRTGTDADSIAVAAGGIRTGLLSVPLRYMHTSGEVVSLGDLELTARLLALLVEEGPA